MEVGGQPEGIVVSFHHVDPRGQIQVSEFVLGTSAAILPVFNMCYSSTSSLLTETVWYQDRRLPDLDREGLLPSCHTQSKHFTELKLLALITHGSSQATPSWYSREVRTLVLGNLGTECYERRWLEVWDLLPWHNGWWYWAESSATSPPPLKPGKQLAGFQTPVPYHSFLWGRFMGHYRFPLGFGSSQPGFTFWTYC